jgi:drug/metabolite transporter (DMT)-like permease
MELSLTVTLIAATAAVLHACWNAVAKSVSDKRRLYLVSNMVVGALGLAALPFVDSPAPGSWPYIAAGSVIATLFTIVLFAAYRVGDLSQIYPTIRGLTPIMIATGAALFAGEHLSPRQYLGIAVVSVGIFSLALWRGAGGMSVRMVAFCALGAAMISGYTVVDGLGVRQSGSVAGYVAWLLIGYMAVAVVTYPLLKPWKMEGAPLQLGRGVIVGLGISVTYGLVVWALSMGAMAPVSALRETSIILAALIGTLVLGEPFGRSRVLAAAIVTLGLLILKLPLPFE